VVCGARLENEKAPLPGPFSVERAGIEPATSGLQILSGAVQAWSSRVDVRPLRDWELSHASGGTDDGQPDLTQI
jgi:hypothetical protein